MPEPAKHGAPVRRRWLWILPVFAVLLLLALAWLHPRLRAAGILLRMEGARAPSWLVHYGEREHVQRPFALPSGTPAILYQPRAGAASGLVLVHGMHARGIQEPRMVAFAAALASSGMAVLTPELADLARYRLTHADVERIAESARSLAERLGVRRVSVFGVSFGGGLALRAACERKLRGGIASVIALGAHHDAAFVSRFFLGERAREPDGRQAALEPSGYGATVLFQSLFGERHKGPVSADERVRLKQALALRAEELRSASPATCPEPPRVPLHLVHGLGDRIVPYTESLWNAAQFGEHTPVNLLISPAIVHAEYAPPTLRERAELVNFMAHAL